MVKASKRKTILALVATDSTFSRKTYRGQEMWEGRCIFTGRKLYVSLDGEPINDVTIEHIVPRTHGGDDALMNLALAGGRANAQKGARLDKRRFDDPTLQRVIRDLQAKRRERYRDPESVGVSLPAEFLP
ncbi:MAG: HNH endonuclease domain-containing protein [Myxococcota bacterium]